MNVLINKPMKEVFEQMKKICKASKEFSKQVEELRKLSEVYKLPKVIDKQLEEMVKLKEYSKLLLPHSEQMNKLQEEINKIVKNKKETNQ